MRKMSKVSLAVTILLVAGITMLFSSARFFGHASYAEVLGINVTEQSYTDGIYTGTADGFRPGIVVEVAIEESSVASVTVTEHHEIGPMYWSRPVSLIPASVVEQQSTAVDTISGATATSKGILAAVEDALGKAQVQ